MYVVTIVSFGPAGIVQGPKCAKQNFWTLTHLVVNITNTIPLFSI